MIPTDGQQVWILVIRKKRLFAADEMLGALAFETQEDAEWAMQREANRHPTSTLIWDIYRVNLLRPGEAQAQVKEHEG